MGRINYRSLNVLILFIGIAIICSFGLNTVSAVDTSTVYVNTHGNDNYDGLSAVYNSTSGSGPKATIKNATKTVLTNGTIYISKGIYNENGITINNNMKLIGESQKNTIINGSMSGSIFSITDANVSLLNLTLTNSSGSIGAIVITGNLTVDNCTFTKNNGTYGGAICSQGTVTINNSILTDNSGTYGGVIYNHLGTITLNNSILTDNSGTYGGAIYNENGNLTVTNSTLQNNIATSAGGAIYNYIGILTLTNSTLTNNTSYLGGAISSYMGTITVTNCTLQNNTATNAGGAIFDSGAQLTITNSTLTNNTAAYAGAIYQENGTLSINFNRIVGNSASDNCIIYCYGGTADANNNWWGSNKDPSANLIGVTVTSWLVLTINTNPHTISNKNNSTVTVDMTHDQNGNYHDPNLGCVPDDIPVNFTSTNGNINSTSTSLINGQATVIFTANTIGIGNITANVDDQTVDTPIKILNGHIYVSPTGSDITGDGSQSNPFKTIKTGVDHLDDYGILYIADGNYYENGLSLNKNVKILEKAKKIP